MHQRGTSALIQNSQGEYLLQFRDGTAGIVHPLEWDFFGGGCDEDEDPVSTTKRELLEELGLDVPLDRLTFEGTEHIDGRDDCMVRCLDAIEWSDIHVAEGAGCAFFSRPELLRLSLPPDMRLRVEKYCI